MFSFIENPVSCVFNGATRPTMFKEFLILLMLNQMDFNQGQNMTGHVLGGDYTNINKYPHAVFLDVHSKISCICGGSILTQDIVLTAAHCFDDYLGRKKDTVTIKYGATDLSQMSQTRMRYYRLHDYYDEFSMSADISLLRCNIPIKLGHSVKRVVIMQRPPHETLAYVSGWGSIDHKHSVPKCIKHTQQKLQSRSVCGKYLSFPSGTFCAGPIQGEGHPAGGDSGGALIIKHYIQIGIVSYKEDITSLVVYTNVSYYYNWIFKNAVSTYCAKP